MNFENNSDTFLVYCSISSETYATIVQFPSSLAFGSHLLACVLNGIIALSSITSNSLIIFTFWQSPRMKEKISLFLVMILACVDLFTGLLANTIFTIRLASELAGTTQCWLRFVQKRINIATTVLTLSTITALNIERYLSVVHPVFHRTRVTKAKHFRGLKLAWVTCAILIAVSVYDPAVLNILGTITTVIFIIFTIYAYTRITVVGISTNRRNYNRPSSDTVASKLSNSPRPNSEALYKQQKEMRRMVKEIKYAKTAFLIVMCYVVSYAPILSLKGIPRTKFADFDETIATMWCMTFVMLNSTLNSVINFWRIGQLRNEAKRLILRNMKAPVN